MSLNQKYTWAAFLKDYPEHREKKTKRTSPEGKKAFEAAYKKFIKEYLAQRQEQLKKMEEKAIERRRDLTARLQRFQKAKDQTKSVPCQAKVGRQDAAIAQIKKLVERTKVLQKKF